MRFWLRMLFLAFCMTLFGCSESSALFESSETDAGVDATSDSSDAAKEAEASAKDAALDTQPDAQAETGVEAGPDAALETSVDAQVDAQLDVSIDGAVVLNPGDLIKGYASSSTVYYYGEDQKRHVFPNQNTFFSWFTTEDFNLVKTIPDEQLVAIPSGKNITIRPGTYLVKITTDPKTYAVTNCGQLHWIESEAIIAALYGPNWASLIVDVPDAFFKDYVTGPSITTSVHPDGTLISYSGDANRYVVVGGLKRKIASDAAFDANHWQTKFIVQTTAPYGDGSDVTSSEPQNFWQIVCP